MNPYNNTSILESIRKSHGFSRSVAILITLVIVGIIAERTIYYSLRKAELIEEENIVERAKQLVPHKLKHASQLTKSSAKSEQKVLLEQNQNENLSSVVLDTQETLIMLEETLNKGISTKETLEKLVKQRISLAAFDSKEMAEFAQIREKLIERNLPGVILKRHDEAVEIYRREMETLLQVLSAIESAENNLEKYNLVKQAREQLAAKQLKRSQQPFDPNNLPAKSMRPDPTNHPRINAKDFTSAGLFNTPFVKLAALGDFKFDQLAGADDPAYLAETVEVKLSDAIKDQAAALNYDPVKIYHWVRNNIDWQPTWGAVQDTDLTLTAKRGNAMDIASLTISLLRASQIPARYVHGTIDVPVTQFMNWTGGFDNIEDAAVFASSGGIPLVTMIEGGQVTKVRMEHVWVEAATDYYPSRGAINVSADSWMSIDTSYKQFDYLPGIDVAQVSGLDSDMFAQDFVNSGSINETEGWVTGFDPTILHSAKTQGQQLLDQYIQNNMTGPTVGDVIGGRKTIVKEYPVLPSGLPNDVLTIGARYDQLPGQLQQQVTFGLGADLFGYAQNEITFPWAQLNNQKVTLSFSPASEADEQALQSLMPEGEVTDFSQFPSTIPAYLVNVIPELKVNGEVVRRGNAIRLGNEMDLVTKIQFPGRSSAPQNRYSVIAGSYLSVNVIAGNVSTAKLDELKSKLEQTKATFATNDVSQVALLSSEDILGDLFFLGSMDYYGQMMGLSHVVGLMRNGYQNLLAGYGTLGYEPKVHYFFGIPRAIQKGGLSLDIPYITTSAVRSGGAEEKRQFQIVTGMIASGLEHSVPEQLLTINDPNYATPIGISAIKAIQIANQSGQHIYRITQSNIADVLPQIHHDRDTMNEISSSVYAGKEVITHTDSVSIPGWTGAGYIILDPEIGDGAFKISGGMNGGLVILLSFIGLLLMVAAIALMFVAPILFPVAMAMLTAGMVAISAAIALIMMPGSTASWDDMLLGFSAAIAVVGGIIALLTGAAAAPLASVAALVGVIIAIADLVVNLVVLLRNIFASLWIMSKETMLVGKPRAIYIN